MKIRASWVAGVIAAGVISAEVATAGLTAMGGAGADEKAGAQAGQKVDLKPKFRAGQTATFTQHIVRKDTMKLSMGENTTADTTVDQTAVYVLRVVDVSDAETKLRLEIKSIKASAQLPSGQFEWDSSAPPDDKDEMNPVIKAFRPALNAQLELHVNQEGNITSVVVDERIAAGTRGPLQPFVQQLVGAESVKSRWGSVLWIKDGSEPAAVGQTWNNRETVSAPPVGRFVVDTTNTLESAKDGLAQIGIKGKLTLEPLEEGKPKGAELSDPSMSGSCTWDLKAGMVKVYEWKQKFTLEGDAQGLKFSRVSDLAVTTTRTE